MLQALRTKLHGWPSIVILGVCVFAISFFGIESYFMSNTETFVAKVGKHEISQQDFQNRLNQLRQQMSEQQGDRFDPTYLDKPETKQRVLDSMIDQQLLIQNAETLGMRVSDQAIRDFIMGIPGVQVDGKFNASMYRAWLAGQGKSPGQFEGEVRSEMNIAQVPDSIAATTLITDADIDGYLNISMQRRDLRYFNVPRPALTDTHVDDAEVDAYYKAHQADFMNPEQVSLKYVEINGDELKTDEQPSDEDLRKRYDQEKQRFVMPEQRLVSHILVNVPKNASPEQQKAALAKAEQLAGEAKPDNFAKLAEQSSDDLGSKRTGGDLGWLEKGVANAAFDDALFAMQKGQVSKPVLSDEGYHILYLRDVRSGQAKPFEEVRDQLAKEATSGAHERKYNEFAGKLTDSVYQNPSSLEPASQALGLPIKSSELFSRQGGQGIAANPKVVQAAFADDVLAQGNNSGLVEISPNHAVVIRVDKHVPAAARPLAEVAADVRQKILDERIANEAKAKADALVARLQKGEDITAVAASVGAALQTAADVTRNQNQLPPSLLDSAFKLPHPEAGKSSFAAVPEDGGAYAVVTVDKVQGADLSQLTPEIRSALRQQMAQAYGQLATQEYIGLLKAKTEIKIAKDRM
ncbi:MULTISPECIES: SurA N-terminal domain-containing protein [Dyella]|uniref:Periplasmic chaperone PpiD n=2 Tax=Dyella TaxID=231454 RepID=A0A4R0YW33_9GAMM|nr:MULTISPECIES: SurA N-terminal domain-containing protein [Dyella]TBR39687.1 peptidylprolyl isomerase [Dyella terrae]TCI12731.1 peptidylprolyl isomerase [Dyella soli]